MGIGENIRQLRESHGMTQSDFGRIAGVSDKAVSTLESEVAFPRPVAPMNMKSPENP